MEAIVKRLIAAAVAAAIFFSVIFISAGLIRQFSDSNNRDGFIGVDYSGGYMRVSICDYVIKLDLTVASELTGCAVRIVSAGLDVVPRFIPGVIEALITDITA